jgi:hypothetical protein
MEIIRTQEEIVDHIEELRKAKFEDFFGFQSNDLIFFLTFDAAKKFLKQDKLEEAQKEWKQSSDPLKEIRRYMTFAWTKANDCRGLSATRSLEHFKAWIWLIDDEFYKKFKESVDNDYHFYGKPQLEMVCKHFNIDYSELDDGIRSNEE